MDSTQNGDFSGGRDAVERFDAFYDFAFPRVYRFAQRRMGDRARAEKLCRLVLTTALASLGGIDAFETGRLADPTQSAVWLYCLARKVADEVAEKPGLLDDLSAAGDLDAGRSLLFLANPRAVVSRNASRLAASKSSPKSS